ncbi:O-antigen ligase family protein [Nakamurella endophytica]|uniref:O-antigen ligase-related domain-containing protein n=1 Tax=Nakamurella endophytica TaxID=1748367 RepID=A0A917SMP5_9ACTN|nr:O-antigen ligase family protein [Nakamurella endophytica]GGL87379.1 hypothetical protein GCM10011594_03690 [Nakamurella endophytica]
MPAVIVSAAVGVFTYIPDFLAPRSTTWVAGVLFTLLFVMILALYRRPPRWPAVTISLALFWVVVFVGGVRYGTGLDYTETAFTLAMVASLSAVVSTFDRRDVGILVGGILVVCGIQLAFAVAETFLGLSAPRGYGTRSGSTFDVNELLPWTGRAPGTFGHAIPLGLFMAVAALLVLFHLRRLRLSVRIGMAALFVLGLMLSGTRSALLSVVIALLFGLCSSRLTRHYLAWRLATCLAALGFGVFSGVSELVSSLGLEGTGSLDHRLAALDALDKLFGRSVPELLFGSGAGSISRLFDLGLLQTDNFTAVDNQWVTLFALGGFVGVGCVVGALVASFRGIPPTVRPALISMFLMFFSFDLFDRLSTLVLFVAILGCGSLGRWRAEEEDRRPAPGAAGSPEVPVGGTRGR